MEEKPLSSDPLNADDLTPGAAQVEQAHQDDMDEIQLQGEGRSPSCRIYLLTVWLEAASDDGHRQRYRLEDLQTGHARGFASLTALIAALKNGLLADTK